MVEGASGMLHEMTPLGAILGSLMMSVGFVLSVYMFPAEHVHDRDHPETIMKRLQGLPQTRVGSCGTNARSMCLSTV